MEYIKKNIVLIVALSLAAIISGVLLYMFLDKHSGMGKAMARVDKIKDEIQNLNKQKPAPVAENVERIKIDTVTLQGKASDIKKVFGKPYQPALEAFIKEMGVSEKEFVEKFRDFWNTEYKRGQTRYQIAMKFRDKYDKDLFARALAKFQAKMGELTMHAVDESNVDDYLIDTLGVPRTMSDITCKNFMSTMKDEIAGRLGKKVTFGQNAGHFSFGEYEGRMPPKELIPVILKHWVMLEDLAVRMLNSGINQLESISKASLEGVRQGDYLKFRYTVVVLGDFDDVRRFVNSLHDAYKQNRVYVVKEVSMEKVSDEVKKIVDEKAADAVVKKRPDEAAAGAAPGAKEFGFALIGVNKTVKATVDFDYVVYVADELNVK